MVFSEVWCHWKEWLTFGGLDFPTSEGVCLYWGMSVVGVWLRVRVSTSRW